MNIRLTIPFIAALALAATSCMKEFNENESGLQPQNSLHEKLVGGSEGELVQGSVLVRLNAETVAAIKDGNIKDIAQDIFGDMEVTSFMPAIPFRPKNMDVARKYGLDQWYAVGFDEGIKPKAAAEILARSSRVRSIQYNKRIVPIKEVASFPADMDAEIMTKSAQSESSLMPFNDPYNIYQWNLANDGSISKNAVAGADIGVKDAWRLTGGDPSVVVAIIDDAFDTMHEDLKNALWVNEAEAGGESGKDDDGNGFIDDKYGFNFATCFAVKEDVVNDKLFGEGEFYSIQNTTGLNPKEGTGHGTHVAGTVAATNNNGKGVSSVAGGTGAGDGVRIMSCQIVQGITSASDAQTAAAFIYAADNGACIAQCSYGNPEIVTDDETYIADNTLEVAAIRYFQDPANSNHESLEGNIAIFAAGNQGFSYSIYPGALSDVISVTAYGYDYLPGGYSNHGPGCNIAAPGGEIIVSTGTNIEYPALILSTGSALAANATPSYGLDTGNGKKSKNYIYMYGTSMACPHVSGVAALGVSYAKKLGKKLTRQEFTSLMLTSVNDINQYLVSGTKKFYDNASGSNIDIPLNQFYGKMGTGALDAWKFLMAIEGTPSVMVASGEKARIDLSEYCSPSAEYTVYVDDASSAALGLTSEPAIKDGFLEIECTAVGSGKITLSSSVGKDPEKEDGIGGMAYSREISITSRPFATQNGGWL